MTATSAFSLLLLLSSSDAASIKSLEQLSHRSFQVRERAERQLSREMPRVRLLCEAASRGHSDPEVRHRARRVVEAWRPSLAAQVSWWIQVWPRRWPHFDMIDPCRFNWDDAERLEPSLPDMMGMGDRRVLFSLYFDNEHRSEFGPDYSQYRAPSFFYCWDLFHRGHQPEAVRAWLKEMAAVEDLWYLRTKTPRR